MSAENKASFNGGTPTVYFTAMWLQRFNPELVLERLDFLQEYIEGAYAQFFRSDFNDLNKSEIDCINAFLEHQQSKGETYIFYDD